MKKILYIVLFILVVGTIFFVYENKEIIQKKESIEDRGEELLSLIEKQLSFGERYIGGSGHKNIQNYIFNQIRPYVDEVIEQEWSYTGYNDKYKLTNIIARINPELENRIIIGTHYDTQKFAYNDDMYPEQSVPGANDGASGTAVLLGMSERLSNEPNNNLGIDLVFFDGEEGEGAPDGDYTNWQPLGSQYFVEHIDDIYKNTKPTQGIIIDMVCDRDLKIYQEASSLKNSEKTIHSFWENAKKIDSSVFVSKMSQEIIDDHTALNNKGIPTILLIDFEYPYFHRTQDTLDKCGEYSIGVVEEVLFTYIKTLF